MKPVTSLIACLPLLSLQAVITSSHAASSPETTPVCVYVSSYHQGYAWSDGVERGLRDAIDGRCELRQFDMDTKRLKSKAEKSDAGKAAFEFIQQVKPDVVITSDDNAAKYLITPFLINTQVPVVFSGINWTVDEYDFPADNVTGIVEVAPIKPMLTEAISATGDDSTGVYLGALTLSEIKNFNRIKVSAESLGISMDSILTENFDAWKNGFKLAQTYDFIVVGSHSGISHWDADAAQVFAQQESRQLSLTNHDWMMPYSVVGYTKIPEEHGEWAASSAIAILGGVRAADIPLVTNRRWDNWINSTLIDKTGVRLSKQVMRKAKRVQ